MNIEQIYLHIYKRVRASETWMAGLLNQPDNWIGGVVQRFNVPAIAIAAAARLGRRRRLSRPSYIAGPIGAVNAVEAGDEIADDHFVRGVAGPVGDVDGHFDHFGVFPEVMLVKAASGLA